MVPFVLWSVIAVLFFQNITFYSFVERIIYPDRGFWFLWVLFFINLFFIFGNWVANKLKIKQVIVELMLSLLLLSIMVLFEIRVLGFQFIAYYFLFYITGYYLNKYRNRIISNKLYIVVPLSILWFVLAWFWKMHELPAFMRVIPLSETIMQYLYRFVTAAIAVYLLLAVSPSILESSHKWNKPFVSLGKISLGIYTVHLLLMGIIVKSVENLLVGDLYVVFCSFVIGVLISWLVVWLLDKWKITSTWLLGKL